VLVSERPCVLLSCGEASGDVYLERIANALHARRPDLRLVGVVGPCSRRAPIEEWGDLAELQVMGFGEVVRHLPRLRRFGAALTERAAREGVSLFLPVDYPGFHVALAGRLRRHGIPTLDFIPPKTWSWGRWRMRKLRRSVDRCAVIFPFEEAHYRAGGVPATFVGHPLADLHADALAESADLRSGLLLVPGSRRQEVARLAPVLADAARRLRAAGAVDEIRVSRAPGTKATWYEPFTTIEGVWFTDAPLLGELRRCAAAIVCSGTATGEAALAGAPHVIAYRTSAVTFATARWLASVEHIGMANIVLGRRAFPEFLQGDCVAAAIAEGVRPLFLADSQEAQAQRAACAELRDAMGGPGAFGRVADLALELLETRPQERR
jgi:lipid-A-disaccharide synthase